MDKQARDLFFHSADIDEHEDRVPRIVLVTGDASVSKLPRSLIRRSGVTEVKGGQYSCEHLKTSHGGL